MQNTLQNIREINEAELSLVSGGALKRYEINPQTGSSFIFESGSFIGDDFGFTSQQTVYMPDRYFA